MNGEGSVPVDRGQWLYRFDIDVETLAMYRCKRAGQELADPEVWRRLATLAVSDVFVLEVPGGWQPFVEVADGRDHWALAVRPSREECEQSARHFLETLAALQPQGGQDAPAGAPARWPTLQRPAETPTVEAALAEAHNRRAGGGWEVVFSRQREYR